MEHSHITNDHIIQQAIAEDQVNNDITTAMLIPEGDYGAATITAKETGIVSGTEAARDVFLAIDPELQVEIRLRDGTAVKFGDIIAEIKGKTASILKGERTALNFLQHLSGIATETSRYVEATKGLPAKIMDTRKTIPGLRTLEKQAVSAGGGKNHRMHMGDGILIKDNHIAASYRQGLDIKRIVAKARQNNKSGLPIEIEVQNAEEAAEAAEAKADIILLDNMNTDELRKSVQAVNGRSLTEASGGVKLDTVRSIAETGVDYISIGAITHSAKALDISLNLE